MNLGHDFKEVDISAPEGTKYQDAPDGLMFCNLTQLRIRPLQGKLLLQFHEFCPLSEANDTLKIADTGEYG